MAAVGASDVVTRVLTSVGSTNDEVAQMAGSWCLATADEQISGRGRLDRTWSSPFGAGIAMSVAFDRDLVTAPLTAVPLIAGGAVVSALGAMGASARLKWPNDVLLNDDLKVGGILVQLVGSRLVVGIGLNVSLENHELPTAQSTSLELAGYHVDREPLIAQIVSALRTGLGARDWHSKYVDVCSTIGREVRVTTIDGGHLVGTCIDIDSDGRLVIRDGESVHSVTVGDVEHVRPVTE